MFGVKGKLCECNISLTFPNGRSKKKSYGHVLRMPEIEELCSSLQLNTINFTLTLDAIS